MLAMFVFFSALDIRHRKIKAYWFVAAAITVITYKMIIFDVHFIISDVLLFGVSVLVICIAFFVTRLFGPADMLGMVLLSFAVPYVGPFPTGIFVLVGTLVMQNYVIVFSNIAYNTSDLMQYHSLFLDVPQTRKSRLKMAYWFVMARRRRKNDRFVLSAQKATSGKEIILSVKRGNVLQDSTKYVFSAHPQYVFLTITFFALWFLSLGIG